MFLSPSPPRLARRSRLDQILLLILRAAVIVLLSIAFARPFLREASDLTLAGQDGRLVAILVDTSASLARAGLWEEARRAVDRVLEGLTPRDRWALFTFDDRVRALVDFEGGRTGGAAGEAEGGGGDPRRRVEIARAELDRAAPGWGATDLGEALFSTADTLAALLEDEDPDSTGPAARLVVISDLQEGSRLEALDAYRWPERVEAVFEVVGSAAPASPRANAGVAVLAGDGETGREEAGHKEAGNKETGHRETGLEAVRVRVVNDPAALRESFSVQWASASGPVAEALAVHVPPGESRVVRATARAGREGAGPVDRLVLAGDGEEFDNTFYVAPPRRARSVVLYAGDDGASDPEGLRYYLERALAANVRRDVRLVVRRTGEPLGLEGDRGGGAAGGERAGGERAGARPALVVAPTTDLRAAERLEELGRWVEAGGTLLLVLTDAGSAGACGPLLGRDALPAAEAPGGDYALLARVDFSHPFFAAFSAPRFGDFTRIHFWKHRALEIEAGDGIRVLAEFESGDPALIEARRGAGRVIALTSGWNPADSQLALSSKFVPLLSAILEGSGAGAESATQFLVGDRVPLRRGATGARGAMGDAITVLKPDGTVVAAVASAAFFDDTGAPGIYEIRGERGGPGDGGTETEDGAPVDGGPVRRVAVNIAPEESRTAPLETDELERRGVRLASAAAAGAAPSDPERRRQLRGAELEGRQKLWRWLVAAALGLVVAETWLAGRRERLPLVPQISGVK
jgi:hypothetical protein